MPALLLLASGCTSPEPAELALLGGTVVTVDDDDTVAQALAVADGRIIAIGSDAEIRRHVTALTEVIDLQGRAVTPGLIDTHFHMDGTGAFEVNAAYPSVKSISDVIERVRTRAAELAPNEWILGRGWDEGKLLEHRYIRAADLDLAAPDNPVFIAHATGHYAVVNSRALKLAGITRESPDPPAGTIDRDEHGNATGVLKERATALVLDLVPPHSPERQREGIRHVLRELSRNCMTAIKDPGISREKWEIYREMLRAGELSARVAFLWQVRPTEENAAELIGRVGKLTRPYDRETNDGRLVAAGVKLFLDGSGGARTAWMHREWSRDFTGTDAGNFGYALIPPDTYRRLVRAFHDAGVPVGTHAIGDRAIDLAVDTYAEVLGERPVRGLRHAIIHANVPTEHAIETMATLQRRYDAGYPESQPGFLWWIGDVYAGNFGRERSPDLLPFRTYLERGVRWAGGSDYDVTPLPAMSGIWATVARKTLLGTYGVHPFGVEQSVDAGVALRSYTAWASHQLFLEHRVGSLEPGKEADLAVWDRNLLAVPAAELPSLRCEMTMLAGRVVHRALQERLSAP